MNTPDAPPELPCPIKSACESCGNHTDLATYEADTPVGVLCLTACDSCALAGSIPTLSIPSAMLAVLAHCEHMGTTLDSSDEYFGR